MNEGWHYWIGALQKARGRLRYIWLDLTSIDYIAWFPGEPNEKDDLNLAISTSASSLCSNSFGLAIGKEYFYDYSCKVKLAVICQKFRGNETKVFDKFPITLNDYIFDRMEKNETFEKEITQVVRHQKQACH
ncbi:hypothetical protein B4U79_16259 [Dinothrombium tinctorium]|uniref:C-type lectin domain-containing protein n=1 Tax=Dinothrombium tinctorium TaxID=1965070 RepID=A0A3S3RW87_9ACAR|nr:hypothetical protein B4U79_16291 [Dinothrombium tinctorium]RWS05699.1 hypothetical protein B4U79_16285 [Dinothrombium tinctorium]RWS05701.1 hypothetical protein B4U79_16282 [Dinothrombium tinctorium]RWS05974.1 hypothetical protein B4U79_16259 [Dinothrombium tinctorium]